MPHDTSTNATKRLAQEVLALEPGAMATFMHELEDGFRKKVAEIDKTAPMSPWRIAFSFASQSCRMIANQVRTTISRGA